MVPGPYERYVPPACIRLASSVRSAAGPAFGAAVPIMPNPATSVSYGMNVLSTYPSRWQRVIADFERDLEAETEEDVLLPLCCCSLANVVYRMKTSSSFSLWRPSISKRSSCGPRLIYMISAPSTKIPCALAAPSEESSDIDLV